MALVVATAAFGSCSTAKVPSGGAAPPKSAVAENQGSPASASKARDDRRPPRRVDPRKNGFEIGLGEWALAPEAEAIRPGKVTLVIRNRGTMQHGFEIALEGDSSGPGSGDLFKAESELLEPGESTRMTVELAPGLYEIECLVDGHDDMGMEGVLEVSRSAPLVKPRVDGPTNEVTIADFSFSPPTATVAVGTEVTWNNVDSTEHTVTSLQGTFGSDTLRTGDEFTHSFGKPGTFAYRCAIHPEMKGKVHVE